MSNPQKTAIDLDALVKRIRKPASEAQHVTKEQ